MNPHVRRALSRATGRSEHQVDELYAREVYGPRLVGRDIPLSGFVARLRHPSAA